MTRLHAGRRYPFLSLGFTRPPAAVRSASASRDQKLLAFVWLCLHRARRPRHEWTHSAFLHAGAAPDAVACWSCVVARERAAARGN